jgi:surfeit locus 1 family protein
MRRPPILATIVVTLAVAAMVGLGLWQLHRLAWKEDLLARYGAGAAITAPLRVTGADLPANAAYRHVVWDCPVASADQVVGGSNAQGRSGWAHVVLCTHPGLGVPTIVPVVIGWSFAVAPVQWAGGAFTGVAVPGIKSGVQLPRAGAGARARNLDWHIVADPPLAGLVANARPDPREIANNHLSYAVQWFLFAATALVIYALALRRR